MSEKEQNFTDIEREEENKKEDIRDRDMRIRENLQLARRIISSTARNIELVAVSKTFPSTDIMLAYQAGQRHFGENYVQELMTKYHELPKDIKWHFIGALQSNKLKLLSGITGIIIETVDSIEKAKKLNQCASELSTSIQVYIQVNTSKEEQKHGTKVENVPALALFIRKECKNLELLGLMTIGSINASTSIVEHCNPDFTKLVECRQLLCNSHDIPLESIGLSMGMTADYEQAIRQGSTSVRIGAAIFGSRT